MNELATRVLEDITNKLYKTRKVVDTEIEKERIYVIINIHNKIIKYFSSKNENTNYINTITEKYLNSKPFNKDEIMNMYLFSISNDLEIRLLLMLDKFASSKTYVHDSMILKPELKVFSEPKFELINVNEVYTIKYLENENKYLFTSGNVTETLNDFTDVINCFCLIETILLYMGFDNHIFISKDCQINREQISCVTDTNFYDIKESNIDFSNINKTLKEIRKHE